MGVKMQNRCRGLRLPPAEKFVLMTLALNYWEEAGWCCISVAVLAEETGLGRSTVARALDALNRRGLVIRTPIPGGATSYRIFPDAAAASCNRWLASLRALPPLQQECQ